MDGHCVLRCHKKAPSTKDLEQDNHAIQTPQLLSELRKHVERVHLFLYQEEKGRKPERKKNCLVPVNNQVALRAQTSSL